MKTSNFQYPWDPDFLIWVEETFGPGLTEEDLITLENQLLDACDQEQYEFEYYPHEW